MPTKLTSAAVLAAVAAAWGTIPLIVRRVDLPAEQLVAARLWLGSLPLLAWISVRSHHRLPRPDRVRIVVLGVILAIHWAAFFWSLKTTTVAIALVLVYLAPVVLAVMAPRILGEPTDRRAWFAVGMALVGVVLVARPGEGATFAGTASGLIAALTFAALIMVGKPLAQRLGGLRLAAYEHTVAALVMSPWALAAVAEVPWESAGNPGALEFWWQLLILGIVLTGIAGVFYWRSVSQLPVTTVGVITYVEPASAVVWAAMFLQETPGVSATLGVVLVIAAGLLVGFEKRRGGRTQAFESSTDV